MGYRLTINSYNNALCFAMKGYKGIQETIAFFPR